MNIAHMRVRCCRAAVLPCLLNAPTQRNHGLPLATERCVCMRGVQQLLHQVSQRRRWRMCPKVAKVNFPFPLLDLWRYGCSLLVFDASPSSRFPSVLRASINSRAQRGSFLNFVHRSISVHATLEIRCQTLGFSFRGWTTLPVLLLLGKEW